MREAQLAISNRREEECVQKESLKGNYTLDYAF